MITILTPTDFVAQVNNLGCAITLDQYKAFCVAVSTVTAQGAQDRGSELDSQGHMKQPVDSTTGKPLQVDKPYDPSEVKQQQTLRSSLDQHLNLCHTANRWVFQETAAKAATSTENSTPVKVPA